MCIIKLKEQMTREAGKRRCQLRKSIAGKEPGGSPGGDGDREIDVAVIPTGARGRRSRESSCVEPQAKANKRRQSSGNNQAQAVCNGRAKYSEIGHAAKREEAAISGRRTSFIILAKSSSSAHQIGLKLDGGSRREKAARRHRRYEAA